MSQVRLIKSAAFKQMSIEGVVEDFLVECRVQGLSRDSLNSHRYVLNELVNDHNINFKDVPGIKRATMQILDGKQNAYYNKQLNGLRKFLDYCVREGFIESNPLVGFKYRRQTFQVVDHSEETIKALLQVMDKTTFSGLRDYAFTILMLDTGIRPNEALQLVEEDIYFDTKQVRVRKEYAKTKKERYLPVSALTLSSLGKLIAIRPDDWKRDVPVLCTYDGRRMLTRGIQDRFREYSAIIKKHVTPYHIRHLFGLWFLRNGGDPFALQTMMGHAKMDITRNYLNLANTDVRENHEKASPLKNLLSNKRVRKL